MYVRSTVLKWVVVRLGPRVSCFLFFFRDHLNQIISLLPSLTFNQLILNYHYHFVRVEVEIFYL